jgi:hypothetical protein
LCLSSPPLPCRRLLTDEDPALRTRLFQVLFQDGRFQWDRLENLLRLAKEGVGSADGMPPSSSAAASAAAGGSLDLSSTVSDGARVVLLDDQLRRQLLRAFTEDDRLHVEEVARLLRLVQVRALSCWGWQMTLFCVGAGVDAGASHHLLLLLLLLLLLPLPLPLLLLFSPVCAAFGNAARQLTRCRYPLHPPLPLPACLQNDIDLPKVVQSSVTQFPTLARQLVLGWSDRVLTS